MHWAKCFYMFSFNLYHKAGPIISHTLQKRNLDRKVM